ncbi:hypothetical protein BDA96_03G348500 [Sorghum bicolor]|uniref:Uncharacterized protein n=2 Tax=Sorghum bicolor TaxID=4558 RepID=A0A921RI19_SORBI|nr:hypothetical protein BDA96_03G348500 [Sorghum bicolor]KXG33545.1 hypothetical protein SORBI_3003G323400 [Sorghum bicolor]
MHAYPAHTVTHAREMVRYDTTPKPLRCCLLAPGTHARFDSPPAASGPRILPTSTMTSHPPPPPSFGFRPSSDQFSLTSHHHTRDSDRHAQAKACPAARAETRRTSLSRHGGSTRCWPGRKETPGSSLPWSSS